MFRCVLAEVFAFGGGHALRGAIPRAAAWTGAIAATIALMWWTPWALWLSALVRVASVIDAGRGGERGPEGGRWHWKPAAAFFFLSIGFILVSATFVTQIFGIQSSSMSPTLVSGDVIVMDKLSLRWRSPERGEPVVYRASGITSVGRVVAVDGDELAIRSGVIHLNGTLVPQLEGTEALGGHRYRVILTGGARDPEHDFPSDARSGCGPLEDGREPNTCRVPTGAVFILGDNRGNRDDSRWRGVFPASSVTGRIVGIWMGGTDDPFSRVGTVD